MLEIDQLSIQYVSGNGRQTVVDDVSVTVGPSEVVALVGESGAGKSTLGLAISGLLSASASITQGNIAFDGKTLNQLTEAEFEKLRGADIASIFQNPMTALDPLETIGQQMVETLVARMELQKPPAAARALALLAQVGLPEPERVFRSYPHELSGGMLQRSVIAIALSCEPSLIIADEPTTALDANARNDIIDLLCELVKERDIGLLLISHDLRMVGGVANRLYVMRSGKVVEGGDCATTLANPSEQYTRDLVRSIPENKGRLARFFDPEAPSTCSTTSATPVQPPLSQNASQTQTDISVKHASLVLHSRQGRLWRSRRQSFHPLRDVSLLIPGGSIFGLVGGSGSGKTTLAKAIAGLQTLSSGSIQFGGEKARPNVQMVFQNPFASFNPRHTIKTQLCEAAVHSLGLSRQQAQQQAEDLVVAVGLATDDLKRYPHAFSGGQLQRLSIARALSVKPSVLICDEPTSALDVTVQASILNLLKDLNQSLGLTILFISHDIAVCRHMCDRIAVMRSGSICEEGPILDVLDNPKHAVTQELVNSSRPDRIPANPSINAGP